MTNEEMFRVGGTRCSFLTSKERDNESGLDHFGARYFSSAQGRFTIADNFLNDTHTSNPSSWNLYVYARNNPFRYVDPAGEEVHSTNLSPDEKDELIKDWKCKTGYNNIYFNTNNELVIDTSAGFTGGSADARTQLLEAATSPTIGFN